MKRFFLILALLATAAHAAAPLLDPRITGTNSQVASGTFTIKAAADITIEAGVTVIFGDALSLANGGTGAALTDPNADRLMFWDDSAGLVTWLSLGSGMSITGTTLNATGSFINPMTTAGDIIFGGASGTPTRLGIGTAGQLLKVNTGATAPEYGPTVAEISPVGRQTIWIPGSALSPTVSAPAQSVQIETTAGRPDISALAFDASTEEASQFLVAMPKSWNLGTITAQFYWSHPATTTNFGVVWGIKAVAISDDDTIDVAYGTAQTVTDTGGTTNDLYVTAETSAVTISGSPAAGDLVALRIYRVAANGSDTLAVDARLLGVKIYYTTSAPTDL